MNSIIKKLQRRYAVKKFDETKKVSDEDIEILLDSLILTPSSYGLQGWKFLVIKDKEVRESLVEHSRGQKQITEATALIVLCRPTEFSEKNVDAYINDIAETRGVTLESLEGFEKMMKVTVAGMSNQQKMTRLEKQLYIALGFLLETAALMDIDACPMEGFEAEKYTEVLGLEELGVFPVIVCPVGYRSEDDKLATSEKVRFSKEQVVIRI